MLFSVVVCGADTHSRLPRDFEVPAGDVLIHAGDFTNTGLPREIEGFRGFLEEQPHPHKVSYRPTPDRLGMSISRLSSQGIMTYHLMSPIMGHSGGGLDTLDSSRASLYGSW